MPRSVYALSKLIQLVTSKATLFPWLFPTPISMAVPILFIPRSFVVDGQQFVSLCSEELIQL